MQILLILYTIVTYILQTIIYIFAIMIFRKKISIFFIVFLITLINYKAQTLIIDKTHIKKNPKVGLVLSGGGAKGFAHVEVIEAIEKAGIKIDYISGTSMGAIVGSLYAAGYSPKEIKKAIENIDFVGLFLQEKDRSFIPFIDKSYRDKYLFTLPFDNKLKFTLPTAISKGQGSLLLLTNLLSNVHDIKDYSKLPIPFLCIATNLETGDEEQMENGFLPLSVLASAAYPSLIEPIKINNKLYIDGGIVDNFPAKALKDKGIDIIIGVDLGSGLQKAEDIKSLINVINQIISYRINMKTDFERSYVNLLIKPDLKDYSVTDFDKKDSILLKGKLAAEKAYIELKKIAKLQNNKDTINNTKEIPVNKNLYVTTLNIEGKNSYDTKYIKRKIGIEIPGNTSIKDISKGISALYSTGNFNRVYYQIQNNKEKNDSIKLTLFLDEKNNNSLKLGIHYDDVYKASILTNITLYKLLFKNSSLSTDIVFSNNFRTYINYFIDNGVYPSIGFNTNFNAFNFNYSDLKKSKYIINRIRNFDQQIYFQSTLKEKYAVGLGLEYSYINFSPFKSNPTFLKDESYFINPYFYIKVDTRDNANFSSRGFKINAIAKQILVSNAPNFNDFTIIKGDLNFSIPITKKLFIENQDFLGTSFNSPAMQYKYYIGGYFEQELYNFKRFLGLPFAYTNGNHLISLYSSINYKILKNHYAKLYVNYANVENYFKDIKYFNYKYSSYGIGYGYDSPFGPINLLYTYSVNQKKGVFSVGLGYWF